MKFPPEIQSLCPIYREIPAGTVNYTGYGKPTTPVRPEMCERGTLRSADHCSASFQRMSSERCSELRFVLIKQPPGNARRLTKRFVGVVGDFKGVGVNYFFRFRFAF
jgi:hypothetical protein